ncbi:hypothetical protein DVK07_07010 [Halorubrum sp. Atlit-26R]|nr:hypothetical protein DVK07_07010 [Halorubrum sp. Atlit-26R]
MCARLAAGALEVFPVDQWPATYSRAVGALEVVEIVLESAIYKRAAEGPAVLTADPRSLTYCKWPSSRSCSASLFS